MYKNKTQYLIESFTKFAFCLIILFRLYYYKENSLINVFILLMSISILLFSYLKTKDKWFKYKNHLSLRTSVLCIVVVNFVIYFAHIKRIPAYVGILIPMLILFLVIFIDYKFNFKK